VAFLEAEEFEAIAATGIDAAIIDAAIEREELDLARLIGPLDGEEVTFRLHPAIRSGGPLCLPRFADSITAISIDGEELDPELDVALLADGNGRRGGCIERTRTTAWRGIVDGQMTAADGPLVKAYLIEAVRLALVPDHERVVAEDRDRAALHRDNAAAMLERALDRLRPVPRQLYVPVGPYGAERITRTVLT
jgi:hypothetical protein